MQDVLVVHCHDSHDDMGECAQNLIGGKLRSRLDAPLDLLVEIAVRAVLHHDEDTITVAEVLMEFNDRRSLEYLEESYLAMRRLFILRVHIVQVDFF